MQRVISNDEFFGHICSILSSGETVKLKVKGYSMTPVIINERDEVILAPCSICAPHKNDIVLFKNPKTGTYILHRIVGKRNGIFIIRGDGNPFGKESCRIDDIAGVVTKIYRNSRIKSTVERDSIKWRLWIVAGIIRRSLVKIWLKVKRAMTR